MIIGLEKVYLLLLTCITIIAFTQIVLLITMSLIVSGSLSGGIVNPGHSYELAYLVSLGYFFIYGVQILTLLLGEKVPFTMVRETKKTHLNKNSRISVLYQNGALLEFE